MGWRSFFFLVLLGASLPRISLAEVKIECSKNLQEDCASSQAKACFDGLKERIFIRCTPGIELGTTCRDVPPMRPDFDFLMTRCPVLHECDHARTYENRFRLSTCMDEYSSYLISRRCYRDAYHQFCPGRFSAKNCRILKDQINFTEVALSYLRCMQKTESPEGCLRTCQAKHDIEECQRVHQAYSGCALR